MNSTLTIRIGDIGLRVLSKPGVWGFGFYEDTQWQAEQGVPALTVKAHLGSLPELDLQERIFRSGGNWTLYTLDQKWVFVLGAPGTGPEPYALAVINREFSSGDVYVRELEGFDVSGPDSLPNPLQYPLDELLMVHLLSQGRGHLFHACGVAYEMKGLLFAGVSGAGKSTIANLWKQIPGATLLSDDRIIIRKKDSRFWMYGTPWHGDAGVCEAGKVVLEKIFFLKHGDNNEATRLNGVDAASRAIVCSFPTYWNRKGMAFALNLCGELSEEIPCYELEFVPNGSIVDLVSTL